MYRQQWLSVDTVRILDPRKDSGMVVMGGIVTNCTRSLALLKNQSE